MIFSTSTYWLLFAIFTTFFIVLCENAYAYLDPGTGSYVLQMIVAGLLGMSFFLRSYFKSVFSFVAKLFSRKTK